MAWADKEKEATYMRAYRAKNRKFLSAKRRAHRDGTRTPEQQKHIDYLRYVRTHHADKVRLDVVLRYQYGVTLDMYHEMLSAQGGLCAICGGPPTARGKSKRLYVDHNHTTGAVRGLLCDGCNQGVARFRDNAASCRAAAAYLTKHGA